MKRFFGPAISSHPSGDKYSDYQLFNQNFRYNGKSFHLTEIWGSKGSAMRKATRQLGTFQAIVLIVRTAKTPRYGVYLREIRSGEKGFVKILG